MKHKFSDLLSLSSAERKGVIVLIVLLIIITGIQAWIAFHTPNEKPLVDSLLISEIQRFEQDMIKDSIAKSKAAYAGDYSIEPVIAEDPEVFYFDPNTITAPDMMRLGFENRLIRTIVKYRNKGGRFYKASDLNKMYGMDRLVYDRISPYIVIPSSPEVFKANYITPVKREKTGINRADSADLTRIYGVGPVLAKRIIRYRDLLGGYYDISQLKEVYGLTDSVIFRINERFMADSGGIVMIDANHATVEQLARHPYIGRYLSGSIIAYRTQAGTIKDPAELLTNGLVTKEQWNKLRRYFKR